MTPHELITRRVAMTTLGVALGGCVGDGTDRSRADVTIVRRSAVGNREHCTLGADVLDELDVGVGDQVRVRCDGQGLVSGLYTVVGADAAGVVGIGDGGLERLGFEDGTSGIVRAWGPHPTYDTRAVAEENDELVELLDDRGGGLVACAPHGGRIEHPTHGQAAAVAEALGATAWTCVGYGDGAYDRWHVTSTDLSRRTFPGLDRIGDRDFAYAVSFHGFSAEGVAVGGGAPESLKATVRDAIAEAVGGGQEVTLADGPYAGTDPENFVNWLAGEGVQIEQGRGVREDHADGVAEAVADVYADLL